MRARRQQKGTIVKWLHRHRFKVVDIQHAKRLPLGGDITWILKRCRCGEAESTWVSGHWPRDRFLPGPAGGEQ